MYTTWLFQVLTTLRHDGTTLGYDGLAFDLILTGHIKGQTNVSYRRAHHKMKGLLVIENK